MSDPIATFHEDGTVTSSLKPGKMYDYPSKLQSIKNFLTGTTTSKDFNSTIIVTWAILIVFIITKLFPETITADMKTAFVVGIIAVIVNKVREATK